jgi:hypothetical protein
MLVTAIYYIIVNSMLIIMTIYMYYMYINPMLEIKILVTTMTIYYIPSSNAGSNDDLLPILKPNDNRMNINCLEVKVASYRDTNVKAK